jgi:hypothetical protein
LASGPVWTGAENLAPTAIRSADRPARRQSLYRLRKVVILHGKIYGSRPYGKLMDRWIEAVNRNVRKMIETL